MEELENSAVQSTSGWYESVSLEDAELYIHANLKSAARSVIAIGYYLKCVNRNELFKEAGYKDICEYAKDRFGFSASATSRYMTRNDKFSVNGNSPILDEKYKDFNKSQLQEMLSLDMEQLEKVSPDMTVVQIREMKKPKEVPYVAIPGQIELTDFPGVDPEDVAAAAQAREGMAASSPGKQAYTISAEDLLPDAAGPERPPIAISQQDSGPEVIHFAAGDRTIDGAYGATAAAVVRTYLDNGYDRPEKECAVTVLGRGYKVLKRPDFTAFYTDAGRYAFEVENARLEEEYRYWHRDRVGTGPVASQDNGPAAESQQGPGTVGQQTLPGKSGKCIHQPGYDCTLEEAHKLTQGTGEDCSQACCWDCARRGDCKLECYSSERRPEEVPGEQAGEPVTEIQQDPEDTAEAQPEEGKLPDPDEDWGIGELPQAKEMYLKQLARVLVQECGNELRMTPGEIGRPSDDTIRKQMDMLRIAHQNVVGLDDGVEAYPSGDMIEFFRGDDDLGVCSYVRFATQVRKALEDADKAMLSGSRPPEPETVIDGEFTEVQEPEEYTPQYFLEEQKGRLDRLLDAAKGVELKPMDAKVIERQKTIVCALAAMVCDLGLIKDPPPKPEQPELPLLKNNDQRAAFVDAYETWPLWVETVKTGERYYRYDLEDGSSMVVKVYHARLFDGYEEGSYKGRYREGYGRHEYYLLQPGKFFRDCETNRSLLIEKLKEIQKVKRSET